MINQTEADPIQPSCPPQQVLVDTLVGEEIDQRLKLETENMEFNDMAEGLDTSSRRSKGTMIARLDLQVEQFAMLALKQAIACSGVEVGQQIDHFATALKSHW